MSNPELRSVAAASTGPAAEAAGASLGGGIDIEGMDVEANRECAASEIAEAAIIHPDRSGDVEDWRRPEEDIR